MRRGESNAVLLMGVAVMIGLLAWLVTWSEGNKDDARRVCGSALAVQSYDTDGYTCVEGWRP